MLEGASTAAGGAAVGATVAEDVGAAGGAAGGVDWHALSTATVATAARVRSRAGQR